MTLHDCLEDLVVDVPDHLSLDARAAWAAGARRRARRRIGVMAAVVVLVALVAGLVSWLPSDRDVPPAGQPGSSPGYPAHVDDPWLLRDLPERPGPLSAVMELPGQEWLALSPDGEVWRVPQDDMIDSFPPALSDDGRMIGYLAGHETFVLRDLVSGEETRFDQVTDNGSVRSRPDAWWMAPQAPGFWSPDGTRLLVRGEPWEDAGRDDVLGLVLGTDGSLVEVGTDLGAPVGWLDDDTIGTVFGDENGALLISAAVDGRVKRTVPLDIARRAVRDLSQWSGALAPDRDRLVLVLHRGSSSLATFSTQDGSLLEDAPSEVPQSCPPAWAGDRPAYVNGGDDDISLDTTDGQRMIVVDPGLRPTCILVAGDALVGPRHEGLGARLFGDTWLSWHWQEVGLGVLGALVLGAAGLAALRWRRRRVSG